MVGQQGYVIGQGRPIKATVDEQVGRSLRNAKDLSRSSLSSPVLPGSSSATIGSGPQSVMDVIYINHPSERRPGFRRRAYLAVP